MTENVDAKQYLEAKAKDFELREQPELLPGDQVDTLANINYNLDLLRYWIVNRQKIDPEQLASLVDGVIQEVVWLEQKPPTFPVQEYISYTWNHLRV